jgi:acyl-CoA synthetase (AMP-forming)/AMP-acid ligase II
MSIKKIIFLFLVFGLLIAGYVIIKANTNSWQEYSKEEIDLESTNSLTEGVTEAPKTLASLEAQARPMPFPGIEGKGLEFMNEEEKNEFRIPQKNEAQILDRDFEGNIVSYKIIRQLEDIIYEK